MLFQKCFQLVFLFDFCHCFQYNMLHGVPRKLGFSQQTNLRQYLGVTKSTVFSCEPRTPRAFAVKEVPANITQELDDMICVIIRLHTLAAEFVKGFLCSFFLFKLRHP